MKSRIPVSIALLIALFCAPVMVAGSAEWRQYASAEDSGYDQSQLDAVRAQADELKSGAVFVVSRGHVLAAWGAVDRKLELHSVRKSLYSAMWGIADARGLVKLDATLEELGIDDLQPLTATEKKARVIDLLKARSGVYHPAAYSPRSMEEALPERGSHAPDTFWVYNNWDFNLAGVLLEKAAGKPLGVLFDEWIAKPIGMQDYRPQDVFAVREPGISKWPALTFRMSARDLARFGQLWLNDGRWDGRQVIPAAWVKSALTAHSSAGSVGRGYGMMWWTYEPGWSEAKEYANVSRVRTCAGLGTGGQMVAVIPEAKLVFVHRGDTDHNRQVSGNDVWRLIDGFLAARSNKTPKAKPALAPVRVEALSSQLPPLEWPKPIALDAQSMAALAGEYELRPGMNARIFVLDGTLFGSFPGKGEAELFAAAPDELFTRVDPTARIRITRDAAGSPSGLHVTLGGKEMQARRK